MRKFILSTTFLFAAALIFTSNARAFGETGEPAVSTPVKAEFVTRSEKKNQKRKDIEFRRKKRGSGITGALGKAGNRFGRGVVRFGKGSASLVKNIAVVRPVRGAKNFGKGVGSLGKNTGIAVGYTGVAVGRTAAEIAKGAAKVTKRAVTP